MLIPLEKDQKKIKHVKLNFSGGMNRRGDPAKVGETEYPLLKNGRVRYENVKPTFEPSELATSVPTGTKQGHYTFGAIHIVFVNGEAYFCDYTNSTTYNKIQLFQMSRTASVIYAQLIPTTGVTTTIRKASSSTVEVTDVTKTLRSSAVNGIPQCLLCQDGVSRPWVIFASGTAREVQDFNDWNIDPDAQGNDRQEYVPIGKQMVLAGGKLYIASPDGTEIYHSVSGRPLDFVIAVTDDGERLNDGILVEASRLSYKAAVEPITCLGEVNTNDGSFYVSTGNNSYLLTPSFEATVYGEPARFNRASIGDSGALNQFAFLPDLLGDSAFVDATGIRSFNSIYQTKFKGENAPLSANVFRLFEGVVQDSNNLACSYFDNYALFSVSSIYGRIVLVYDTIIRQYVAFDQYDVLGTNIAIKQFALLKINNRLRLFFITSDNKLFEAFAGSQTSTCEIYVGDWMLHDADRSVQSLPRKARVVFLNVKTDGTITAREFVDNLAGTAQTQVVVADAAAATLNIRPLEFPFGSGAGNLTEDITFDIDQSNHGWKCGLHVSFNFDAELAYLELEVDVYANPTSSKQIQSVFRDFNRIN